mgnify:CR=1 FL=1
MSQRFLDIHILGSRTGFDRHRYMPMVGGSDQDRIDVLAVENFTVLLACDRTRIGQLLGHLQVHVPNIADRSNPDARYLSQGLHQLTTTSTCPDASDIDGEFAEVKFCPPGIIRDRLSAAKFSAA